MKTCLTCQEKQSFDNFYRDSKSKDKLSYSCKFCIKAKNKEYYKENRLSCMERSKKHRMSAEYYRNYVKENIEKVKQYRKAYYQKNKEKDNLASKQWRLQNRERINERERLRLKSDPQHKLRKNLRNRLLVAIKRGYKAGSAVRDLGCSIESFKIFLENQFYPHLKTGEVMSWSNYGRTGWHIDHIKPLASFDLADREQFLKACHYTNMRPLWAEENLCRKRKE